MSRRGKDHEWDIYDSTGNTQWDKVPIAVLQDIRDELKSLNRLLGCNNFTNIPWTLRSINSHAEKIGRNTAKKRKKKPVVTA